MNNSLVFSKDEKFQEPEQTVDSTLSTPVGKASSLDTSPNPTANKHLCFVYGTLKQGFGNHYLIERQDGELVGEATITGQMRSAGGFPYVFLLGDNKVHGEVWNVNDAALASMDRLEGHPDWYTRTKVASSLGEVWIYAIMNDQKYTSCPIVRDGIWAGPYYGDN